MSRGFTLLELALTLVVVGLFLAVGASLLPWTNEKQSLDKTRQVMAEASNAVIAFSLTNNRLPCPADPGLADGDTGYGEEDCSRDTGTVPHVALLLSGPMLDTAHRAIVYSVYRNPDIHADLATLTNLFDGVDEPVPVLNVYDFCQALKNAVATAGPAFSSTSTSITTGGCATGGSVINPAFVLASPGLEDADGDGNPFDGDNAAAPQTCFASPDQGRDAAYDDLTAAVSFADLRGKVCP